MSKLDDICVDAFTGLYGKESDHMGMDFNFVPMEDSYGVLKDSLKSDIKDLFLELIGEVRGADGIPHHDEPTQSILEELVSKVKAL